MTAATFWNKLGRPRLLVLGDLMLDRYVWGEAERVSPEAPVLVLKEDLDEVRPGGAANVASFLRGLEVDVVLAGCIGDDAEARTLQRLMSDVQVDTRLILTDPHRTTTSKQRIVGRTAQRQPHQILRVDRETRTPLSTEFEAQLVDGVLAAIASCDAILISDYAKGVCTSNVLRRVIDAARLEKIPVLIDPCRDVDYERYSRATLITPNRTAARQAIRQFSSGNTLQDPGSMEAAARALQQHLRLDAAVLTLDRDGLAYATASDSGVIPCRAREVCDVTGAGDMVLAILGLCLSSDVPLRDSLELANIAAGLEVERFGVEPLTRAEIAAELSGESANRSKLQPLEIVAQEAEAHRRAHRTIVFTNGCFDLLHVGHLTMLQEAARIGDVLIVAINSDASIRRLKGATRPIMRADDRAQMLAALACVDRVLIFDGDTPCRLLEAIRPDVLIKGGTTGEIIGREIVEGYGGCVCWATEVPGLSTTSLVQRMQTLGIPTYREGEPPGEPRRAIDDRSPNGLASEAVGFRPSDFLSQIP